MLHATAKDHFDKLSRVMSRLDMEVHKDHLDDFFKTAWHLREIIKKDPATTCQQRQAIEGLSKDSDLALCGEIANKQKHFVLDEKRYPNPQIASASTNQGWGVGRYGVGAYGVGEQAVTLKLNDGTTYDAHALARAIYNKFAAIF